MGYGVGVLGAGDGCRSSRRGEADLRQSSGRAACLIVAQEENHNRCLRSHGHCVRAFVLCCLERHCVEVPVEGGRLVGGVVRGVSGLRSSRRAVLYLGGGVTVRVSLLLGGVIWGISFLSSLKIWLWLGPRAVARTKVLTRLDRTTDVTGPKGPSSPVRAAPAHRTQLDLEVDVEHQHMLSACARAKKREIITIF